MNRILIQSFLFLLIIVLGTPEVSAMGLYRCQPTTPDADGPFYRPGAPERSKVGEGYLLSGTVKSATDCSVLPGTRIEIWLNGPDGHYGDNWRATLYADAEGRYSFESHIPVAYGSRPPHIHIIVSTTGFAELITQHYPENNSSNAAFDLVLIPDKL